MKRIILIFLGLFSLAYAQYSPTSAKTRFVNGISLGTKVDAYYNAADSNAIYWRADSVLRAKYRGLARTLAFIDNLADSLVWGNITGLLNNQTDLRDTLAQRVNLTTVQSIGGVKTFTSNTIFGQTVTAGQGDILLDNNGIIYANAVDIGQALAGVYTGIFGNSDAAGKGVAINAGTGQLDALTIRDYTQVDTLLRVKGNGTLLVGDPSSANDSLIVNGLLNVTGTIDAVGRLRNTGAIQAFDRGVGTTSFQSMLNTSALNDSLVALLGQSANGTYNLFELVQYQRTANASTGGVALNILDAGGRVRVQNWERDSIVMNRPLIVRGSTTTNSITATSNGLIGTFNSANSNLFKIRFQDNLTDRSYLGADATNALSIGNGSATLVATVNATTGAYTAVSDSAAKKNIRDAGNALSFINQIKVRQYDWKANNSHEPFGVIAQELHKIIPAYVSVPSTPNGRWGVQKAELVPMLIKGIQEQQNKIESLEARIASLEAVLKKLGLQ